jgi:hypothetical protein
MQDPDWEVGSAGEPMVVGEEFGVKALSESHVKTVCERDVCSELPASANRPRTCVTRSGLAMSSSIALPI